MSAKRQRQYRERNQRGGLVQVTVWVPADRVDDLRAFVTAACLEAGGAATPARVRRTAPDPAQLGLLPRSPDEAGGPQAGGPLLADVGTGACAAGEEPPSRSDDAERPRRRRG